MKKFFTDEEIAELEKPKAKAFFTDDEVMALESPAAPAPPADTRTDAQFIKDAVRPKSTWGSRLTSKLNESADNAVSRLKAGDSPITSGLRAGVEGVTNIPRTAPVLNKLYDKGDEIVSSVISGITEAADKYDTEDKSLLNRPVVSILKGGAGKLFKKMQGLPQPAKDVIATGVNLLDFIPGTGAVAKAPGKIADTVEATGEGLLKAGKRIKRSETKIPKSVAKSAYGKSLMEKADGIIETMAEFGLTEGDNAASAMLAKARIQERVDAVDNIVKNIAQGENAPQVVPVRVALKGLKVKELANTGGRPEARQALKKIILDMVDDGHDKPVGIEQLIEAKKNLNRTGDLFSNGPATPESIASRELRRKMYLNLTDEIGRLSPETKALNTEVKRLLDAQAALEAAAYRESNKDIFGLTDHILGGAALANPGALWAAVPMAMGKQAIKGGRFGSPMIRLGKKILGRPDRTISQTLGEVAARNAPEIPVTPSSPIIRDPKYLIERTPFQIPPRSEMYPTIEKPVPTLGQKLRSLGEPGTPSEMLPSLSPAATYDEVISRSAERLRVTPAKLQKILSDEAALEDAIRAHEVTAEGVEAARRETEAYMSGLKKPPVLSVGRLRALKNFRDW